MHRKPGQTLIEFALIIGVLLFLIFGGMNVVQYLWTADNVQRAARAAAFAAALDGKPTGVQNAAVGLDTASGTVADAARSVLLQGVIARPQQATIQGTCPQGCARYKPITLTVTYATPYWAPIAMFQTLRMQVTVSTVAERDPA